MIVKHNGERFRLKKKMFYCHDVETKGETEERAAGDLVRGSKKTFEYSDWILVRNPGRCLEHYPEKWYKMKVFVKSYQMNGQRY